MNSFERTAQVATAVGVLSLAGCSHLYEGKYEWGEGWRTADVIDIQLLSELKRPDFHTCVRAIPAPRRVDQRIAILSYRGVNRRELRGVPIAEDAPWRVGQKVYLNITRCEGSIAPRSVAS